MTSSVAAPAARVLPFGPANVLLGRTHTCHQAAERDATVVEMPALGRMLRHAVRTVLVASLIPTALFYATLATVGLDAAVTVALVYYYGGIGWRLMRRQRVLGAAILGAALLTLRSVTVFLTGSAFLYFLQPVAGTVLTATVIATSALAGRPLIDRLAHDFCPMPHQLAEKLRNRQFFRWASAIWAAIYVVNAVGTVWVLTSASVGGFLLVKSLLGPALTTVALIGSYGLFRVAVRREDVVMCWAEHDQRPTTPAS